MTDRIRGVWVAFDNDIRDDDVENIVNAILMVKHVQAVTAEKVEASDWMNRERVRQEYASKTFAALNGIFGNQPTTG